MYANACSYSRVCNLRIDVLVHGTYVHLYLIVFELWQYLCMFFCTCISVGTGVLELESEDNLSRSKKHVCMHVGHWSSLRHRDMKGDEDFLSLSLSCHKPEAFRCTQCCAHTLHPYLQLDSYFFSVANILADNESSFFERCASLIHFSYSSPRGSCWPQQSGFSTLRESNPAPAWTFDSGCEDWGLCQWGPPQVYP